MCACVLTCTCTCTCTCASARVQHGCSHAYSSWCAPQHVRTLATGVAAQLELMVQFKKIAADKRIEGKGKKKREVVSVNGGGKTCVDMACGCDRTSTTIVST